MLNVPTSVKSLYQTDGVRKNFRVHFPNGEYADITNDNVVQESVKFTESLCSQSTFKFGLAEASVLEFETVGVGNMFGMTIEASMEIDGSSLSAADKAAIAAGTWDGTWDSVNEVFGIPLGIFQVNSCPRDHQSMAHRQVTAYTTNTFNAERIPFSSYLGTSSNLKVSVNGLISQMEGSGLSEIASASMATNTLRNCLSATDGTYRIQLKKGAHGSGTNVLEQAIISRDINTDRCDFCLLDNYNALAYGNIGEAAIAAYNSLNLNTVFINVSNDLSGSEKYSDTGAAFRDALPWLFSPCLGYMLYSESIYEQADVADGFVPLAPNKYAPIINGASTSSAFEQAGDIRGYLKSTYLYSLTGILATDNLYLEVNKIQSSGTISATYYADLVLSAPQDISISQARRFKVNTLTPYIVLENSGNQNRIWKAYRGAHTLLTRQFAFYTYYYEYSKLLNGAVEAFASFVQCGRGGTGEVIRLDNSSPTSIVPDNYEGCWWDEFDIAPIGTVIISYTEPDADGNDQENTTNVSISGGASIYDMSSNELLKLLTSTTFSSVLEIINNNFAPYAPTAAFTPTELTMQGWPWLEAGDALEITAEDGTIVETYALRVEMSGIQHLTSVITAEGGEIIEEVS